MSNPKRTYVTGGEFFFFDLISGGKEVTLEVYFVPITRRRKTPGIKKLLLIALTVRFVGNWMNFYSFDSQALHLDEGSCFLFLSV